MSNEAELERRRKLAESLMKGEVVKVNPAGAVESEEEAQDKGEQTLNVPQGKMA